MWPRKRKLNRDEAMAAARVAKTTPGDQMINRATPTETEHENDEGPDLPGDTLADEFLGVLAAPPLNGSMHIYPDKMDPGNLWLCAAAFAAAAEGRVRFRRDDETSGAAWIPPAAAAYLVQLREGPKLALQDVGLRIAAPTSEPDPNVESPAFDAVSSLHEDQPPVIEALILEDGDLVLRGGVWSPLESDPQLRSRVESIVEFGIGRDAVYTVTLSSGLEVDLRPGDARGAVLRVLRRRPTEANSPPSTGLLRAADVETR